MMSEESEDDNNLLRDNAIVQNLPPTAYYVPEFVSESEERALLAGVYAAPRPKWTQLAHRRLQNWGGLPHARGMLAEPLPTWLERAVTRVADAGALGPTAPAPNHVLVNEYRPGQGILPHVDGALFYPAVATVTLGAHGVLRLAGVAEGGTAPGLLLEARSLVVLRDALYTRHMHYIEERTHDAIDHSIANLNLCSDRYTLGSDIPRGTRVSLTIRHVPKTTSFKINIGNKRLLGGARRCSGGGVCGGGEAGAGGGGGARGTVVGVHEAADGGFELTTAARQADQQAGGVICKALAEWGCQLKTGRALLVGGEGALAVAALGPRDPGYSELEGLDETRENVRSGVGAGVALLAARGCSRIRVDPCGAPDAAAEAAELAAWKFQEFKSCGGREPEARVELLSGEAGGGGDEAELWRAGAVRGRAQNWARFLSDMPANRMTPVDLAQAALDVLCPLGVKVEAHDRDWIVAQNMRAFLAVARGSCEEPVFLECSYDAGGRAAAMPPVLLAAKGITFDSGGLCLKKPEGMVENRGSMAGAAVALAALRALAELKVGIHVKCVIPLCENMVSGQCMKVGDVVPALNGLSIQVEDTDMEGRLLLADALVFGQARYRPALVVDVATLTRGILLATGGGAFGCFTNSEGAWRALRAAGASSGDRPWRFPLWQYYHNQLTNEAAVDLRNKGSGRATPCLGAAFLRNFICGDWVHMDITGVGKLGHAPAPPYLDARRMTGRPARTLHLFLERVADKSAATPAPAPAT